MFSLEDVACVLIVKWSFLFGAHPSTVMSVTDDFRRLIKEGKDATLDLYDPGSYKSRRQLRAEWDESGGRTSLDIDKGTAALHIHVTLKEILAVSESVMKAIN